MLIKTSVVVDFLFTFSHKCLVNDYLLFLLNNGYGHLIHPLTIVRIRKTSDKKYKRNDIKKICLNIESLNNDIRKFNKISEKTNKLNYDFHIQFITITLPMNRS